MHFIENPQVYTLSANRARGHNGKREGMAHCIVEATLNDRAEQWH